MSLKRLPIIKVEQLSLTSTYITEVVRRKNEVYTEYLKELCGQKKQVLPSGFYRISKARGGRFGFFKTDYYGDEVFQLYDHVTERVIERPAGGSWCAYVVRRYGLARARFNMIPAKAPKGL